MIHRLDIQIRDPFIYVERNTKRYYLFGTTDKNPWNQEGQGFNAYVSSDLELWDGPFTVFTPPAGFWGTHDFWAPEVHYYKGAYYMFATFTAEGVYRGTQLLRSPSLLGPYIPLVNSAVTPTGWQCLDGTLYVDDTDQPWIVFCREWVQVNDGEVWAMPLSKDLKEAIGEPVLLFAASSASWPTTLPRRDGSGLHDARVTDGPFLCTLKDGSLVMLWSSTGSKGYAMGYATSETGLLAGPWLQSEEPLIAEDGGHGMVFVDLEGKMQVTYHTPNKTPFERFVFEQVLEVNGTLKLAPKQEA